MKLIEKNNIKYYTRNNLVVHQQEMLKILKCFAELCSENNIDYWLDGGSLLGLARHNSQIPWDDDIDICVPVDDYYRLIELLKQYAKENNKYSLYYSDIDELDWCEYFGTLEYMLEVDNGIIRPVNIDIFPVKYLSESEMAEDIDIVNEVAYYVRGYNAQHSKYKVGTLLNKRKKLLNYHEYMKSKVKDKTEDCYLVKGHGQFSPIKFIESKHVFPTRYTMYEGIEVKIPHNVEKYLEKSYGKNYLSLPNVSKRKPQCINTLGNIKNSHKKAKLSAKLETKTTFLREKKLKYIYTAFILCRVRGIGFTCHKIFKHLIKR